MESKTIRDRIKHFLNERNLFTNTLATLEIKTKVDREYIFYGLLTISLIAIILDSTHFLSYLVGIVYPICASLHSVETGYVSTNTKWNVYWSIFAVLGLLEYFYDYLLFWIPLYSLSKSLFLIWLMFSGKRGGTHLLYNDIIRPLLTRRETEAPPTRYQEASAPPVPEHSEKLE